eukprot:m.15939 g.15939  ORF g.15939 m.15939 type:complete len:638 (-) comp5539_c0_seq1:228-2141(-)
MFFGTCRRIVTQLPRLVMRTTARTCKRCPAYVMRAPPQQRKYSQSVYTTSLRTHTCGDLGPQMAGETVTLCAWVHNRRDFGKNLCFVTLRDAYGAVQLYLNTQEDICNLEVLRAASLESVVIVTGVVRERAEDAKRGDGGVGDIEIVPTEASILNNSAPLPFSPHHKSNQANHEVRHKYRYIDLRRAELQENLRLRSQLAKVSRDVLTDQGFLEIETPTLFKRTPGGAAEFPVPTRNAGLFYTLVQSPQQFKQLLMVAGYDRYYQLARCYRDEGGRGDRQPEFTQIDLEMSFVKQRDIEDITEKLIQKIWKAGLDIDIELPFPRMRYATAMARFGVDKPDTRYGMELVDVTQCFEKETSLKLIQEVLHNKGVVQGIKVEGGKKYFNSSACKKLQQFAKGIGVKGVITVFIDDDGSWSSSIAAHVTESEREAINQHFDASPGDMLILSASDLDTVQSTLGKIRIYVADELEEQGVQLRDPKKFNFLWVDEFPLFEYDEGKLVATHHVFTAPHADTADLLMKNPLQVRGQHFDIVANGIELGGGSVRNHDPETQKYIISDILNEDLGHFEHMLEALSFGAPPHGGIALGFDRLVMIMAGARSLRDVLAFPKSFVGKDLMGGAPDSIDSDYLKLYHIKRA